MILREGFSVLLNICAIKHSFNEDSRLCALTSGNLMLQAASEFEKID